MHKYVIMGVQGCGKGTQASRLAQDFDFVHISVGDIFRWNIRQHTKLAAKINEIVSSGRLVPDEIVQEIVGGRLDQHDWNYGFILDGFPRNPSQAQFLLDRYEIDSVIHIDVPDEIVLRRVLARRHCSQCKQDYNLVFSPPKVADTCDLCQGTLVARADDTEAAVRNRLQDYHTQTEPVLDVFREKGLVVTVDGANSVDEVQTAIRAQLGLANSQTAY
ncbi:MAG: nucleoside monophosphate kinase [Candidatus Omnitrophica bacterium]|nr:nucleoside monophosphate kinase [Candidatus Omnitrophota bacterium]